MIEIDIKIDKKDLQSLNEKNIKEAMGRSIDDLLVFMEGVAVKVTPTDTGFLRKGFKKEKKGLGANFFNDVKYAPHVNFGTGIYGPKKEKITPKNGKYLKTPFGPRTFILGQKANPFMENILKEAEGKIEKIFIHNFNEVL